MSRKLAREAAFKALFQLDFNFNEEAQDDSENLAIQTMFDEEPKLTSKKDFSYIDKLIMVSISCLKLLYFLGITNSTWNDSVYKS